MSSPPGASTPSANGQLPSTRSGSPRRGPRAGRSPGARTRSRSSPMPPPGTGHRPALALAEALHLLRPQAGLAHHAHQQADQLAVPAGLALAGAPAPARSGAPGGPGPAADRCGPRRRRRSRAPPTGCAPRCGGGRERRRPPGPSAARGRPRATAATRRRGGPRERRGALVARGRQRVEGVGAAGGPLPLALRGDRPREGDRVEPAPRPAAAASQQATGAAVRCDAWAATPASVRMASTSSSPGAAVPSRAAKASIHSRSVIGSLLLEVGAPPSMSPAPGIPEVGDGASRRAVRSGRDIGGFLRGIVRHITGECSRPGIRLAPPRSVGAEPREVPPR